MTARLPRAARVLAALTLVTAVVSGCSAFGGGGPTAPPADAPAGMSMSIQKIAAQSGLEPMGLNADRTMQVPPLERVEQAGWYSLGPAPGDVGPAVIMGHVNGGGRDGVFARLDEVRSGDKVQVTRDGRQLTFTVGRTEVVDKDRFPTGAVYSDTAGPELRLITCGGDLDRNARSYLSNVIVFATLDA